MGLANYISGYFCKSNLGIEKGTPYFYEAIINQLGLKPSEVTMVGDSYEKDILPALEAGLGAIWYSAGAVNRPSDRVFRQISCLRELCILAAI